MKHVYTGVKKEEKIILFYHHKVLRFHYHFHHEGNCFSQMIKSFGTEYPDKKNSPLDVQTRQAKLSLQLANFSSYKPLIETSHVTSFFSPLILDRFAWSCSDSEHSVPLDDLVWSRQLCFLFQVIPLHPEYLIRLKYYTIMKISLHMAS